MPCPSFHSASDQWTTPRCLSASCQPFVSLPHLLFARSAPCPPPAQTHKSRFHKAVSPCRVPRAQDTHTPLSSILHSHLFPFSTTRRCFTLHSSSPSPAPLLSSLLPLLRPPVSRPSPRLSHTHFTLQWVRADTNILQYALTLELLENAFYTGALGTYDAQAFADAGFPPWVRGRFEQISEHEQTHVAFLTSALGNAAPQPCTYSL